MKCNLFPPCCIQVGVITQPLNPNMNRCKRGFVIRDTKTSRSQGQGYFQILKKLKISNFDLPSCE